MWLFKALPIKIHENLIIFDKIESRKKINTFLVLFHTLKAW